MRLPACVCDGSTDNKHNHPDDVDREGAGVRCLPSIKLSTLIHSYNFRSVEMLMNPCSCKQITSPLDAIEFPQYYTEKCYNYRTKRQPSEVIYQKT